MASLAMSISLLNLVVSAALFLVCIDAGSFSNGMTEPSTKSVGLWWADRSDERGEDGCWVATLSGSRLCLPKKRGRLTIGLLIWER